MSSVVNLQQTNGAAADLRDSARPDSRPQQAESARAAEIAHVVVLGAGPAGAGASFRLAQRDGLRVTVLEQREAVGGNAGSFMLEGICATTAAIVCTLSSSPT